MDTLIELHNSTAPSTVLASRSAAPSTAVELEAEAEWARTQGATLVGVHGIRLRARITLGTEPSIVTYARLSAGLST
jgi:hypothetical protein